MKRLIFLLLLLIGLPAQAATAFTEWYCRTNADGNLNAGDTTDAAATVTYAGGTFVAATGVYTVASGNPVSDGITPGRHLSIYTTAGATVATFISTITATNGTTITVAITAGTGVAVGAAANPSAGAGACTAKYGGAWRGPNAAVGFPFNAILATATNGAGNIPRVNMINGSGYGVTAAVTHTLNGPVRFEGCTASAGDGGRWLLDCGNPGTAITGMSLTGTDIDFENCIVARTGGSGANGTGIFTSGARNLIRGCVAHDCWKQGISSSSSSGTFIECEAYACNAANTASLAGFVSSANHNVFIRCNAHDNAGANTDGFYINGADNFLLGCIADTNGKNGIESALADTRIVSCDLYNNAANGIDYSVATVTEVYVENSNFLKNTTAGINSTGSALRHGDIVNCGFGVGTMANGADLGPNLTAATAGVNVTGTVNYPTGTTPWADPANGDFRIIANAAKGQGRGRFTETQASYSGTSAWMDIGSGQHRDTSSAVFSQ